MTRRRPRDEAFDCLTYPRPGVAFLHHRKGIGLGPAMQLVELVCLLNAGHTLGLVITDDTGRIRLVNAPRDPAGPRLRWAGAQLAYTCHPCRRAGEPAAQAGAVALASVLDLSAALAWAWADDPRRPAGERLRPLRQEAAAAASRRDLRRVVREVLNGRDHHRDERRAFRDRLYATAGVSARPET